MTLSLDQITQHVNQMKETVAEATKTSKALASKVIGEGARTCTRVTNVSITPLTHVSPYIDTGQAAAKGFEAYPDVTNPKALIKQMTQK